MASTSASFVQKSFKYDVFLSFRGNDTRKTLVDHLYHALHHKGIIVYKDDERIKKGERIHEQLLRSIEDSKFHIIILSKNYASSSWCLDELVKIMECHKTNEQTAFPIFYDVEPTEVRKQSGAIAEAFARHENVEAAGRWRDALKEVADLAGWDLRNTANGHESKFIQKVVGDISQNLLFINLSVDEKLIGMQVRVKKVLSSLETGFDVVRVIGIKGIGGGGKTTLARAVFNHISTLFECKSFIENVREGSKGSGLKELQKQVLSAVLNDQSIFVASVSEGKSMMKRMMPSRKVLVVLDDVDDIGQLEALAGEITWFKPGSKIIITTRDEQVLVAHGVHSEDIHDVNLLSRKEASCLFSRYAFKREIPIQGYEELSEKVLHYAAGLPLTIKVLGSFLCGRNEHEWEDALERLKTIPLKETLEKLELSFNGLENDQKEIFLDVACILKGETKRKALRILESCGFHAQIGLRVLEQKSLITIMDDDDDHHHKYNDDDGDDYKRLLMHDHIEEMGMNIVRRLHPEEPNKHNRLWIRKEIEDVLVNESGTKATRSIDLRSTNLHPTIIMKGLRKMKELRFLHVGYDNMAWEGDDVLNKLRFLDLSGSDLRTLDLGMTPNLEILDLVECKEFVELIMPDECHLKRLNLGGCNAFVKLHMLGVCPKLKFINPRGSKVSNLNLGLTPNLNWLDLGGCNDFVELHMPVECPKLTYLNLSGSNVSKINLALAPILVALYLYNCRYFAELQMPIECLKLKYLNLYGSKVSNLNLALTPNLEKLYLEECDDFVELNPPTKCPKLKFLRLSGFKGSNLKPGLTPVLEKLESLEQLSLSFKDVKCLPDSICMLKHLEYLNLKSCWLLEQLPEDLGRLECLKTLILSDCVHLQGIPNSVCKMKCLRSLDLSYCLLVQKVPKEIGQLESLLKLNIEGVGIRHLPRSIFQLERLRIVGCRWRLESYGFTSLTNISRYTASCYISDELHKQSQTHNDSPL